MSDPRYPNPRIPYVHGRDLVPIRTHPRRLRHAVHEQLFAAEDRIRARIEEIDQTVVDLATERKALLDELRDLHDELRPPLRLCRGRRRRAVSHEEPLPPVADDATWVWGRELRSLCLAILRRARKPLTLRHLHVLLHRAGYAIEHHHPAKALADALGHETDAGRAVRHARATYTVADNALGTPAAASLIPDW
jgi:hypothetical protein